MDKGFAPLYTGHEPIMLLLHQSTQYHVRAQGELESPTLTVKTLCLNHLTIEPYVLTLDKSPMQVSHLLLPITKRVHYFYANQAVFKNSIVF